MKTNPPSQEELIDIGIKMAQTIQEFADDLRDSDPDCNVSDLELLIEEWHHIFKRTRTGWQEQLQDHNSNNTYGELNI